MTKHKSAWRIWALALGEKTGKNEKEADIIALIRTIVLFSYMVTNGFIIANALHNFSQPPRTCQIESPPKRAVIKRYDNGALPQVERSANGLLSAASRG